MSGLLKSINKKSELELGRYEKITDCIIDGFKKIKMHGDSTISNCIITNSNSNDPTVITKCNCDGEAIIENTICRNCSIADEIKQYECRHDNPN